MDDLGETARMFTAFHNEKLSKAQRLMADDGMPESGFLPSDARASKWKGRKLTKPSGSVKVSKDEDPATAQLRKQLAADKAKKQKERLSALREQKEASMAAKNTTTKKPARVTLKVVKAKPAKKTAIKKVATEKARTPVRPKEGGRRSEIIGMLKRAGGVTIPQIQEATGMLPHSARALLSGIRKTEKVETTKEDGCSTVYRIK